MTELTRALFVSAALLLPFLSACSADSGSPVKSSSAVPSGDSAASVSTIPSSPPYAIILCTAGLNGHCYNSVQMRPTFDSAQSCLAALPAFANGHIASEDGRAYITNTTWYECDDESGKMTRAQVPPAQPRDESASSASSGSDLCRVVALVRVPSIEDPESALAPGETHDSVTQYRVSKKTGAGSFCTHGGYCYPRFITIGGKMTEALQLQNCRIGGKAFEYADETGYGVVLDRSKNSEADLKYNDLTNTLSSMGLCNACAGNAAQYYLQKPSSECGLLVKSALEGDPASKEKLLESPDYCQWRQ